MKRTIKPLAAIASLVACGVTLESFAHGYVSEPAGRPYMCKLGQNTGCGAVQWEPQSVEGPDGNPRFPTGGPEDGTIAAAGSPAWSELNAQTPSRWNKHSFTAGPREFEWTFTANHVSKDWRYFITRPGWDATEPLSRDAFDLTPFCEADGGMVRPPMTVRHSCVVPERQGYHVILAVWDVGDTAASFYNAIDVNFAGDNVITDPVVDPIKEVGMLSGAIALEAGDTMSSVVYDADGEIPELSVSITAEGYLSGPAAALEMAREINATGRYFAGQRDGDEFIPAAGANTIYAEAPIRNVEIRVDFAPEPDFIYEADLSVASSLIEFNESGMADIDFSVATNANMNVAVTLFDAVGDTVSGDSWVVGGNADLSLHVHMPREETYTMVMVADAIDGNATIQKTVALTLVDTRPVAPAPEPQACDASDANASNYPAFRVETTYTGGEQVAYQGLVYQAKWWTRGNTPNTTDAFELISDVVLEYSDNTVYQAGDRAIYQGQIFEAKWWTRGTMPSDRDPWTLIGDADC